MVALALVACASCSSDEEPTRDLTAFTTTSIDGRPSWLDDLGAPSKVQEGVTIRASDGSTERVWVDKDERMVYARTCELAQEATKEGAYYGPGNFGPGPGFAYICP